MKSVAYARRIALKMKLRVGLRGVVIGFAIADLFDAALGLFLGETMLLVGVAGMATGQAVGVAIMWFFVAPPNPYRP